MFFAVGADSVAFLTSVGASVGVDVIVGVGVFVAFLDADGGATVGSDVGAFITFVVPSVDADVDACVGPLWLHEVRRALARDA
jgi:hypothetical protein